MWVLWIAIVSGSGTLTMSHQRFDTRDACESAAKDVRSMPAIKKRLELAGRGNAVFVFDYVCSGGASKHQGAE